MRNPMRRVQSPTPKWFYLLALLVVAIVVFFGVASWNASQSKQSIVLDRIRPVTPFILEDQNERIVTLEDLKGKIWVAGFIATKDRGVSQIIATHFAELDQNFHRGDSLRLVTLTVDPQYDTPKVLNDFAAKFEATRHWYWLTGHRESLKKLAIEGLGLETEDWSAGKAKVSGRIALVDKERVVRGYYDGTTEEGIAKLLSDVGSLLRQGGT
jgi:protein SCO1